MRRSLQFIGVGTAVVLSFAVTCAAFALTDRSAANGGNATAVTVNRTNKGDRLPLASRRSQHSTGLSPARLDPTKRVPVGCEPAFSPVAEPAAANIILRCLS